MLNAASKKIKTEKLLIVAHSQGNFYANNFYNKVIDREGGIPRKSIAVYSVASPAKYVAGGGKYLTSSTDSVINEVRYFIKDTLKSNVDIKLNKTDDKFGHSFSNVYLKYQGPRIISDIHSELSDLKNNNIQNLNAPCLAPPKLTFIHKVKGIAYEVADPTANLVKYGVSGAYKVNTYLVRRVADVGVKVKNTFKKLLASAVGSETNSVNTIQVAKTTVGTTSSTPNLLVKGSTKIISTTKKIKKTPVIKLLTKVNQNKNNEKKVNKTKTTVSDKIISQIKKPTKENTIVKLVNKNRIQNPEIKTNTITDQNMPVNNTVYYYGGGGGASSLPPPDKPIILDTIAPVISMIGDNSVIVNQGDNYKDDGATAFDETDGVVKVVVTGKVDTATLGTYVITYTASDLSKNTSTLTRTVKVESPFPNLIINSDTTLSAGEYSYNNLIITNNATLTLEGDSSSSNLFKGVKINANNLTLDSGSTITASGQGPTKGPGTSTEDYSGGSYGGQGEGNTLATTYGSATKPIDLGSGGTAGQPSGGAIRLVINDTLQNDGIISANGRSNSSGGSIYVTTKNLTGTGSFQADGGGYYTSSVYYGTGSGGRIALYYETSTFTGTALAQGGCGSPSGTLYCASDGSVGFFDTLNNNLLINSSWQFRASDSPFNFNDIDISNKAKVTTEKDAKITAHNINIDGGSTLTLSPGDILNMDAILLNKSSTLISSGKETINTKAINVSGNSTITVVPKQILFLTTPNLTLDSGSTITASGQGPTKGPGTSTEDYSGGSYGGQGEGNTLATTYGSATKPIDLGSGGTAGQPSGGAIRLVINDTLQNDGIISANGRSNSSGGSIYVTTKNLTGTGSFQADGGGYYTSSVYYGTGSGGRIALYYETSTFTGTALAQGGCGSPSGTLYCASDGSVGFFDTLNNNLLINSSWQFRASDSPFNFNDIDISNKAKVTTEKDAKITAHNINIDGGSTLTLGGDESIVVNNINLLGDSMFTVIPEKILFLDVHNIYVEKGSIISANGKGYLKGPGSPDVFTDGGSSYGGLGGGSKVKPVYGSAIKPIDFGSGNGSRRGGGAIRLIVSNVLKNNGTISSNAGFDYVSGGSIYITADKIVGSGVFSTRGGSSYFPYKTLGGGGGRIALHYKKDFSFTGISVVSGGIYCSSNCNSVDGYGTVEKIDDSIIIPLSSKKQITSFSFLGLSPKIEGAIDKTKHKILITVPSDTDVTILTPTVVYTGTSVSPLSGVVNDFTSPVTYTTTAEDGTTQSYIVTVIVSTPTIDTTPPSIINYTLNGATSDITINPLKTPLKLSFTSSGNVNWMSIKIESQTDSSFYKMFHSDTKKCIDGTDTCVKTWDGILSKGGLLKNDTFLIKVHIKDKAGEYYDYLPSIITVDTSLKS